MKLQMLITTPIKEDNKVFNATVFVSQKELKTVYKKIHLFDVQLSGEKFYRESLDFERGQKPSLFSFKGWKLGLSICYDLRFAELYGIYAQKGAEVLIVPSSFLKSHRRKTLGDFIESSCH